MKNENVVVLGASPKEERYSNKAVCELVRHGHNVFPIHPRCAEIHGRRCYRDLGEVDCRVDTLTLYVGEARSLLLLETILSMKPSRVIMNPGAENELLERRARESGIEVIRGCTLVMLSTGQF